jgi:hypothetical protein
VHPLAPAPGRRPKTLNESRGFAAVSRTAGIGASRPLPSVPTKVRLLNRLPTPDVGGGDYSSCPTADLEIAIPEVQNLSFPLQSPKGSRMHHPCIVDVYANSSRTRIFRFIWQNELGVLVKDSASQDHTVLLTRRPGVATLRLAPLIVPMIDFIQSARGSRRALQDVRPLLRLAPARSDHHGDFGDAELPGGEYPGVARNLRAFFAYGISRSIDHRFDLVRRPRAAGRRVSTSPTSAGVVQPHSLMLAAMAATWASVWVRAFLAYGISRSIAHRSTLSAGHGL